MTAEPEFSPLGPDAPKEDRIGTALWSMGSAAAAGVVWFSVLLLLVSLLRGDANPQNLEQVDPHALYVNVAAYGTMLGIGFIWGVAWLLLKPIPSLYRRGALAMVAALGGWCIAMGATFLARTIAGTAALAIVLVIFAALALYLRRRAIASAIA